MEKSVSGALNVLFCTQPESTPIQAGGLRLGIGAVSRLNAAGDKLDRGRRLPDSRQSSCLHLDFGNDHAFPRLLAQGFWSGPLRAHAGTLGMMALDRQKKCAGLVIGGAKYDWRATFGKFNKDRVGPSNTMSMDDDRSDLIKRHAANGVTVFLNKQKTTIAGKVATILTDIYDLIQSPPHTLTQS